jgi:hypothetical protein
VTWDEVTALSTGEILSGLEAMGVSVDKETFLNDAREAHSLRALIDLWLEDREMKSGDPDLIFASLAAVALAQRWDPKAVITGELDRLIREGYRLCIDHRAVEGCQLWLEAWENLKGRFAPGVGDVEEAEDLSTSIVMLFNWCQDLEMELGNAGVDDPRYYEKRLRYCQEFCARFPGSQDTLIAGMKVAEAESYFALGMAERGERVFEELVAAFPRHGMTYLAWGDVYRFGSPKGTPPDFDRAERIYRLGLEADVLDAPDILERLADLEQARKEGEAHGSRRSPPVPTGEDR